MEADLVLSATLVAVIVNDPAVVEENTAEVAAWLVRIPPVLVQLTPAPPRSFVTVALSSCVCDVVSPANFGLRDTATNEGCVIVQLTVTLVTSVPANVPVPLATVQV